jgi:hypothetical protein
MRHQSTSPCSRQATTWYNIELDQSSSYHQLLSSFCFNITFPDKHMTSRWCFPLVVFNEVVSKSFRTGRLERELQIVQLSATRCSCIAILWVSLVSFATITLGVSSQRVLFIVVDFIIDSFRKLLDTLSCVRACVYYYFFHAWYAPHCFVMYPLQEYSLIVKFVNPLTCNFRPSRGFHLYFWTVLLKTFSWFSISYYFEAETFKRNTL